MTNLPLMEVLYLDHASFQDEELDELEELRPWPCRAVGYLEAETETYLRLLHVVEEDPRAPGEGTCSGFVVLRSTILEVRELVRAPAE